MTSLCTKHVLCCAMLLFGGLLTTAEGQQWAVDDWNWTESISTIPYDKGGHHLYLGKFEDRLYYRGGSDDQPTLEVYDWSKEHLFSINVSFVVNEKTLSFDRLIETRTGLIGTFKWADRDNSRLEVYTATLSEDAFAEPSLLLSHDYLRVIGIFKNAYPLSETHIFRRSTCHDYFISSDDLSYHLYSNGLAPIGYSNKVNQEIEGRYFALFDANFEIIREWTIPTSPEYKISSLALSSTGEIYFRGIKAMKFLERNEALAGKKGPSYYLYFGTISEQGYTVLPLGLADGHQATNYKLELDGASGRFAIFGFYTDGTTKGNMSGLFVVRGEGGSIVKTTESTLPNGFENSEVLMHKSKMDGMVQVIRGERIADIPFYSTGLQLKSRAQGADETVSLVFEFDNASTQRNYRTVSSAGGSYSVSSGTSLIHDVGALFFVTIDRDDRLMNVNYFNKLYHTGGWKAGRSMIWHDADYVYAYYMTTRSRKEIKNLDGAHEFGEMFEFGKWDHQGGFVEWEILTSGIKDFETIPKPLIREGQEVLFESFNLRYSVYTKLEPSSFRLATRIAH